MKRVYTGLLLTGLAALSACGGGGSTANKASNVVANDIYVVPDDLGNDVLLNDSALNSRRPDQRGRARQSCDHQHDRQQPLAFPDHAPLRSP